MTHCLSISDKHGKKLTLTRVELLGLHDCFLRHAVLCQAHPHFRFGVQAVKAGRCDAGQTLFTIVIKLFGSWLSLSLGFEQNCLLLEQSLFKRPLLGLFPTVSLVPG